MERDKLLLQAIPHVFLPKKTPEAAQTEQGNIEQFILHSVHQSVLRAIGDAGFGGDLDGVLKMLELWELLQPNHNSLNATDIEDQKEFVSNFVKLISSPEAQTIPLYVRKQNCTILIEKQEDGLVEMETFRAALPSQLIMSNVGSLSMNFPETRYVIQNKELLSSSIFAEGLYELATEKFGISTPVIHKAGRVLADVREVAEPSLINSWMATVLSPTAEAKESQQQKKKSFISKKIRDQVTLTPVPMSSSLFPFRRSGLWLSIKVALQLKLLKIFHNDAKTSIFVYKLLMLRVLVDICKNYYDLKEELKIDLDLAAQMLAKLGNRVMKIQQLPHSETKTDVFSKLSLKLEVMRVQVLEYVEGVVRNMQKLMKTYMNVKDDNDDQLPLRSQQDYLNDLNHSIPFLSSFKEMPNRVSNDKPTDLIKVSDDIRGSLKLQRYATLNEILTGSKSLGKNYTLKERIWFNDTETFMKNHLSETDSSKIQQLVQTYVKHGLNLYKNNPIGISQMILAVLKAVEVLDRKAAHAYPLLLKYNSGITCQTFDCLLLPYKDDMTLLDEIVSYFQRRNKNAKESSGILTGKVSQNSFAAIFASQDSEMMELRQDIHRKTDHEIAKWLVEVNRSRVECENLLQKIRSEPKHCSCQFTMVEVKKKEKLTMKQVCTFKCKKCRLQNKLRKTRTRFTLFERPLPKETYLQNAVVFELLIPKLISDLRDCLAILKFGLLEEPAFSPKNIILIEWINYKNLQDYLSPNYSPPEGGRVIRLGSRSLNISATCYRKSKPDILVTDNDQLIVDNGLKCIYTYLFTGEPEAFKQLQIKERLEAEWKSLISPLVSLKKECSFQINVMKNSRPYLPLQKYLQSYSHSQNDVIANQASCHENISLDEFLSFGSIRAGHRIQLRNLYRAIASKVLSLEEEAVLALVLQTIWEVGPSDEDMNNREAHLDFEDAEFCSGILEVLEALVDENTTNYSHPFKLMTAVVITVRILELNEKVTERCLDLLKQWRLLMRRWTQQIEVELMKGTDPEVLKELQKTLLLIRICSALSYNFSRSIKWDRVMNDQKDIVEWYHTISSFSQNKKNELLLVSSNRLSKFMHILLNIGRNVALQLELETELLSQTKLTEALRMFVTDKWTKAAEFIKVDINPVSKDRKNLFQLAYVEDGGTLSDSSMKKEHNYVTFDLILGTFLVNGFPEGQLPIGVTSLPYFQRFFHHNSGFRVQRESSTVFRTSAKFHGKYYEFVVSKISPNRDSNDNSMNVVIKEISDNGIVLTLLQSKNFLGDFVSSLVEDYTHWFDPQRNILYFRRIPIQDSDYKLPPEYKLVKQADSTNWHLIDERNHSGVSGMLSIHSEGFKNIANALKKLELSHHIKVVTNMETKLVSVYLHRYNLRFFVNPERRLESVEYPGLCLVGKGKIKTLIGLQNGIQLRSESKHVLMVPNGSIHVDQDETPYYNQTFIALEELRQPSYFIYEFDKVLKRLVANKSKQAWLYLGALNAVTSSSLPDPFTGVTGTEMAVRILQSGFIWSCSPYDEDSLRILKFIKSLAPKRSYYGNKFLQENDNQNEEENKLLGSIEAIKWPIGVPSMAAYDGYEIIVDKLIEDSERLGPLYYVDKEKKKNVADDKKRDLTELSSTLQLRSYFRHLNSYNQGAAVKPNYFRSSLLKEKLKVEKQQVQVKSTREELVGLDSVTNTALLRLPQFHRSRSPLFRTKTKNDLLNFLMEEYQPYHDGSPDSLKDIFSLDFRTNWSNIYGLAVQKNRSPTEEHRLTLMLCAMAYKKAPIDQILNLHYISTFANQIDFPQPIQFPDYGKCQFPLADPSESEIELEFRKILLRNVDLQRAFREHGLTSKKYQTKFRGPVTSMATNIREESVTCRRLGNRNIGDVIANIRDCFTQLYIKPEEAISQIDDYLSHLHWTAQLKQFASSVQNMLDGIHNLLSSKPTAVAKTSEYGIGIVLLANVVWKLEFPVSKFLDETQLNQELEMKAKYWFRTGQLETELWNGDPSGLISQRMASSIKVKQILQNLMNMQNGCTDGKIFCWTGLQPRSDPTSLLKCLTQKNEVPPNQTKDKRINIVKIYAGALAVLWVHIKRLNRCLAYQDGGQIQELQREMENVGHENWKQKTHPEWLLLELELDIMIRPIQIEVAQQMMKMPGGGNGVMQLNMGEGKTSVIVPMLCSTLGKSDVLCRVTVLSSMFNMNNGILTFAIGGLLDRRVYTIPCRRDMEIDEDCANMIQNVYRECLGIRGVLLTLPEHRLSFRLLAYDNILKADVQLGMELLKTENWLRLHARDILDESDELLNPKYQLVYTVGEQISLDGGELRWTTCQKLLRIVQEVGRDFLEKYGKEFVEFDKEEGNQNPHHFTPLRLLDHSIFPQFVSTVAERFIDKITVSADEKLEIQKFLTQEKIQKSRLEETLKMLEDVPDLLNSILIISGYLRRGVLTLGLSKRWRVEYGVDTSKPFRRMAVPFRAKDVPAERTEFGHPDLAILLTHLSYYYSGLSDIQLEETIKLLGTKQGSEAIYESWMTQVREVPENLSKLHGLNLKDARQRSTIFVLLRRHRAVVDFWLSHKVFPRESKQFPAKLVMTSWDLCYERQVHPVTGFSGTNDSAVLLPLAITQQDLPSLLNTNKEMEGRLLHRKNQGHRNLEMGVKCIGILNLMKQDKLTVLIDAGALMLEFNNEEVAKMWLQLDMELEAVLYFGPTNELVVRCRTGPGQNTSRVVPFELSSFQDRLDKCGVFLDDQHTRGTDLKFPVGTRGCVTVGGKMKRDKLIQACMRMRKLGQGHSVTFYLSHEAYEKIRNCEGVQAGKVLKTSDVLEWTCQMTQSYNEDGLLYWAIAGKNYAQRLAAEDNFYFPSSIKNFQMDSEDHKKPESGLDLDGKANILGQQCMDVEVTNLMELYGNHIQPDLIVNNISKWKAASMHKLKAKKNYSKLPPNARANFETIYNGLIERCQVHIPNKTHVSGSNMEEEQERELELEKEMEMEMEEELIIERRGKANPAKNNLHQNVLKVILHGEAAQMKEGIMRLCDIFKDTTFWGEVQPEGWGNEVFATTDFIRIVKDRYVKTDLFIRPVEYVVSLERKSGMKQMLVLSPFEVNELMPMFRNGNVAIGTRLHMFSLRRSEKQNLLLNESRLMLPKASEPVEIAEDCNSVAALLLASGNLYFHSMEEQKGFAKFLRLAPRPWTKEEEKAFEQGLITKMGYMLEGFRNGGEMEGGFERDPSGLVRKILMCRHPVLSDMAHVVRLLNGRGLVTVGKGGRKSKNE